MRAVASTADGVAAGRYRPNAERVFDLGDVVAARRFMEDNRGSGELVVTVGWIRRGGARSARRRHA